MQAQRGSVAHRGTGEAVRRKSRWGEQNGIDTDNLSSGQGAANCSCKMGQDLRISLPHRWTMQISSAWRGIAQCYLPSNKDDRAEVDCLTLLQTNHHPNFSSSFSVGMPHTPETGLHSPPCPRMYHVTRHGQWETGGHLSTHFLRLDKAPPARYSVLFYQEL